MKCNLIYPYLRFSLIFKSKLVNEALTSAKLNNQEVISDGQYYLQFSGHFRSLFLAFTLHQSIQVHESQMPARDESFPRRNVKHEIGKSIFPELRVHV